MRLCLRCKRLSPAGSLYCGFCARSFGVRYCQNKHANAPQVRCCTVCASPVLTEPTRFLRLGWVGLLLAALCALAAWKWALAHLCLVVLLVWDALTWAAAVLLNTSACRVRSTICLTLGWLAACWILGQGMALAPGGGGQLGRTLRTGPALALRLLAHAVSRLARLVLRSLQRALWPPTKTAAGQARVELHDGDL